MPQKIFTADAFGKIEYVNPQWIEYSGLPLEEILGDGWAKVLHPDEAKKS